MEIPSEPEPDSLLQSSYGSPSVFRTPVRGEQDSTSGSLLLTSQLSPQKRYDLIYRGNPDTQPIRSYEIAFLVRIFHQICSNINDKVLTLFMKIPVTVLTSFNLSLERSWNNRMNDKILLVEFFDSFWYHRLLIRR